MHAGRLVPGYVSRHWWAVGMKACLPFAEKSTLVLWYVLWVEVWRCQDSGSFSVTNQSWVDYWLWTIDGGYSWWYCCKLRPLSKIVEGCAQERFYSGFPDLAGIFKVFSSGPASVVRSIVSIAVVRCSMKAACIACTVRVEVHFIKHYTHETCSDVYIHGK